ncbi:MAG: two-component system response regulator CreB [Methylococcaceae bacterium]|nr:two-component system response regulator CreB [Methylococcaceae bacterium]
MKASILLIEDEAAIADNVVYALETDGFKVQWVELGEQGLDILKNEAIDLVVLDIGLPDINGFEVCKIIRRFSQVPIIFLTARNNEVDRIVGLEIGGDDYLSKPFSPRELSARVKVILKRVHPQSSNIPPVDLVNKNNVFVVKMNEAVICYKGNDLNLTRYEYLILNTLLRRPGQVFSREQLIQTVWNNPETSYDRAVDTHIKTLRAKLKEVSDDNPIKTHRGFGYSIKAKKDNAP